MGSNYEPPSRNWFYRERSVRSSGAFRLTDCRRYCLFVIEKVLRQSNLVLGNGFLLLDMSPTAQGFRGLAAGKRRPELFNFHIDSAIGEEN